MITLGGMLATSWLWPQRCASSLPPAPAALNGQVIEASRLGENGLVRLDLYVYCTGYGGV